MIYTSYFAAIKKMPPEMQTKCVSVSLYTPKGVKIPVYKALTPTKELLTQLKATGNTDAFYKAYREQVLNKLDSQKIYNELDGKVLVCYEKAGNFCHRNVIADWFKENNLSCKEVTFN